MTPLEGRGPVWRPGIQVSIVAIKLASYVKGPETFLVIARPALRAEWSPAEGHIRIAVHANITVAK